MNFTSALGLVGLMCLLSECGGESDTSQNPGGTGGTGGSGSSATGGSSGVATVDRTCNVPSDCVVQSLSCCASCGAPNPSNFTAMNYYSQYDYQRSVCAGTPTCLSCDAQVGNNYLQATCDKGQCILIDLREQPVTACSNASQCYVRAPECCECGGRTDAYSVIALSSTSTVAYSTLVCSPNQACADCAPIYPAVNVDCIAGHCQIVN